MYIYIYILYIYRGIEFVIYHVWGETSTCTIRLDPYSCHLCDFV